jgi:tetratricopeptide (TPR) repeat protein
MRSRYDTTKPSSRKRWGAALGLLVIAILIGAVEARRRWSLPRATDDAQLGLLMAAWTEFNANQFDRATGILNQRAEKVAPTPLDWILRARIANAQNDFDRALEHLKKIPDSDPTSAQAWLMAGQIELARHRLRASEAAFLRSHALDPEIIQVNRELAYLYALKRRKNEADVQFRALAEHTPPDAVIAFAWCQSFCGIWDPSAPRASLSEAVKFDPDDRWSRLALASSFQLTNELDQAEATLKPLPDSDPDARAMRAEIAISRGNVDQAEALVKEGPTDHVRLNVIRGQLQAGYHKNPRQAATFFRAAVEQGPEDRDAIHGLGYALERLGDPKGKEFIRIASLHDALTRKIKDSVATINTNAKIFDELGEICESLKRYAEARIWFQLAIRRDPTDGQAQTALVRINETMRESKK